MEWFAIWPVAVLTVLFTAVATTTLMRTIQRAREQKERAALEHVALRCGGRVTENLALELTIDGAPARLTYGEWDDGGWTRFEVECALPGQLHVRAPAGAVVKWFARLFGAREVQVGDPRIDGRWAVQGQPLEWVQSALSRAAGQLDLHGEAMVDATATGIRISVPESFLGRGSRSPDRFALQRFLEKAIALARAIRGPIDATVPRVVVKELLAAGRCPVCTDAIDDAPERCPRCDTAHHAECWAFLGGCAVFACDARRARTQAREPAKGW